ncbi:MAG: universal stress protein [Crocinitomicaceae bacterium]|nr:universal stress protein [Crocinitomicaceae bacterium]MDG1657778.1 universal stress protein [Crocinitomicaceae bacterium]MDG2441466.1 universal stress protein [Crocinitomicaceae bacterium]
MSKNLYMVPYDFTPISQKALEYALHLGKHVHTEIKLVHLSKDKPSGKAMLKKLDEVRDNTNVPLGVEITSYVRVGSIFTDIGKLAKKEGAQLIIMGTHGKRGLQRFFGSHAMKVITSAECPFLIVQKNTQIVELKKIVVPIDLTKESLQIVNIAGDIARMYDANISVLAEKQTDQILNTRLKNRISIVSKQYEERDINAKIEIVKNSGAYRKKVMTFAKDNQIELIAIAYHTESLLPQFDKFAQGLITNKLGLPVLVVNSKLASALYF